VKLHERMRMILNEIDGVLSQVDEEAVRELVDEICKARRVFVFGQGRSGYVTRAFAVRLMHLGIDAYVVGDTTTPSITSADLCLINSGTGETRFSYHVVVEAREAGAKTATITAHPEARIGQFADIVVKLPAPTRGEKPGEVGSRQLPGSLFEQAMFVLLDAVVLFLMERFGQSTEHLLARHANIE